MKLLTTLGVIGFAALTSCQQTPDPNAAIAPVQPNAQWPDPQQEVGQYQPVAPVQPVSPPAYTPPPAPAYTPPPPPAPVSASATSHVVAPGDTLWGLSRKYNTSVEAISAANGLTGTTIVVGQSLAIPQ